ncbi:hypothetical protein GOV07_01905 [Candidatus Woesearchaeota archaeon]|nr:hypothetical protein [Candidatus Woesearchaeota archaeon]
MAKKKVEILTSKQQLEKKTASLERKEKKLDKQKEELAKKEEEQKQEIDLKSLERRLAKAESKVEFSKTYRTTIIGALTFVAGLFWRDVITEFLELVPILPGWLGTLIWALLFTTVFVILIVKMNKGTKKDDAGLDTLRKKVDDAKVKKAIQEADEEKK